MREFFFRVASLTFEANVLAELEKSGSRRIGEVVSKYLSGPHTQYSHFLIFKQNIKMCKKKKTTFSLMWVDNIQGHVYLILGRNVLSG